MMAVVSNKSGCFKFRKAILPETVCEISFTSGSLLMYIAEGYLGNGSESKESPQG
jgi:hypothetical protein